MLPAGVILAGGRGARIGGDKPLRRLAGRPLLEHVIARARPQVGRLWLSTRGNARALTGFGLPVVEDDDGDAAAGASYEGPIAGIVAGLTIARRAGMDRLAVFPCDVPFFPTDLVARLGERLDSTLAVACIPAVEGQPVPVFGLWEVRAALAALAGLPAQTNRLKSVCLALGCAHLEWNLPDAETTWLNVNSPEDLMAAEAGFRRSAIGARAARPASAGRLTNGATR
jgi:molybdopterin-guanine dinucleotide biosynthesis protein A